MSHNVREKSSLAGTDALANQQLIVQDDHVYSAVDDTQGQMFMVSSNPAYGTVTEHSRQPLPQDDDHTYSTVDSSQQEIVITAGNPAYGTSLSVVARAK